MAPIQELIMPVAILDFGTNTFNLLLAEHSGDSFSVAYDGKQPVKLGKGGINKRFIAPEAMERGFAAIEKHMETIKKYGAKEIHAYATSAMRNAENGEEFAGMIQEKFGFKTTIIDGDEEAELIYGGIRESVDFGEDPAMIMDIGGGSIEFIICNGKGILWKQSFELGMARIIEQFTISDPITEDEIAEIEEYYHGELEQLRLYVDKYKPTMLVGASGTFDTLAAMARYRFGIETKKGASSLEIPLEKFRELRDELLQSTTDERLAMKGMEPVRVEMMVPATIFINFVIESCNLASLTQSRYALKEGVMARLIHKA